MVFSSIREMTAFEIQTSDIHSPPNRSSGKGFTVVFLEQSLAYSYLALS